jgi:hypothetical protein
VFISIKSSLYVKTMYPKALIGLALITLTDGLIRFQCSQLVYDRLDPLVHPGVSPTPHLHQIVGGVGFLFLSPVLLLTNSNQ